MLSKSRLSLLRALRQKKIRTEQKLFVAEGSKLVIELLSSDLGVKCVYATQKWQKENARIVQQAEEFVPVDKEELSRISSLVTAPEVLAIVKMPEYTLDPATLSDSFTLMLDGIRDPGNMGTIIRVADWFGITDIVCSPDCAEVWNPKVVQASMGSLIRVKIHESPLVPLLTHLRTLDHSLPVFGTFLDGKSLYKTKFDRKGIVIIGNESNGISEEVSKLVNARISIPVFESGDKNGRPESLNAAIATAITLSEVRRIS